MADVIRNTKQNIMNIVGSKITSPNLKKKTKYWAHYVRVKGNDKKYKGDSISNLLLVQDLNVLNIEFFPQMEQLKHQIMRWKI